MRAFFVSAEWKPKKEYQTTQKEIETRIAYRANMVYKNVKGALTDRPVPELKSGEVLLKIGACGVCGTDVHALELDEEGYTIYPEWLKFPLIMGHEMSGIVEEVSPAVKELNKGDIVTVEEINWCGLCEPCRSGRPNQCANMNHRGITMDGGFAEYIAVHERYCWKINNIAEKFGDEKKALEAGAMVEPCGVAYNGIIVQSGGIQPGGHVAIFGSGPIGQSAIALARTSGAALIIVFEPNKERQENAKLLGADYVFDPHQLKNEGISPHEVIMDLTEGVGVALCIEAAGVPQVNMPEIAQSLAVNGNVNIIGLAKGLTPTDLVAFQTRGGHIHGSSGQAGHGIYPSIIRLIAAGRIDPTRAIAGRYPLDQAQQAIKKAPKQAGKVLISAVLY